MNKAAGWWLIEVLDRDEEAEKVHVLGGDKREFPSYLIRWVAATHREIARNPSTSYLPERHSCQGTL